MFIVCTQCDINITTDLYTLEVCDITYVILIYSHIQNKTFEQNEHGNNEKKKQKIPGPNVGYSIGLVTACR